MIPRIRGRVGQAETPIEFKDKWFFTIWVSDLGEPFIEDKPFFGPCGPWDTEELAGIELNKSVKFICEKYERIQNGQFSGEYIDMKDNTRKKFK